MSLRESRLIEIESALGARPREIRGITGGDANSAATIEVGSERVFVKWSDDVRPRCFESEARGLDALRRADCGLHVPRVLAYSDRGPGRSFLALEYFEAGRRCADFEERLGRGLARLHGVTTDRGYGFDLDGYCGASPQPNPWNFDYREFFANQRLRHQARLGARPPHVYTTDEQTAIERLAERVPDLLPDPGPPALIHGDLWAGNVLIAPDGSPALIDPAAHYADREAEFGMLRWFGNLSSRFDAAYEAENPLPAGHSRRCELFRLYHVMNHFHLFGGGYREQVLRLVHQLSAAR